MFSSPTPDKATNIFVLERCTSFLVFSNDHSPFASWLNSQLSSLMLVKRSRTSLLFCSKLSCNTTPYSEKAEIFQDPWGLRDLVRHPTSSSYSLLQPRWPSPSSLTHRQASAPGHLHGMFPVWKSVSPNRLSDNSCPSDLSSKVILSTRPALTTL